MPRRDAGALVNRCRNEQRGCRLGKSYGISHGGVGGHHGGTYHGGEGYYVLADGHGGGYGWGGGVGHGGGVGYGGGGGGHGGDIGGYGGGGYGGDGGGFGIHGGGYGHGYGGHGGFGGDCQGKRNCVGHHYEYHQDHDDDMANGAFIFCHLFFFFNFFSSFSWLPVKTIPYLNVDLTFVERYECQIDVRTTLCACWALFLFHLNRRFLCML